LVCYYYYVINNQKTEDEKRDSKGRREGTKNKSYPQVIHKLSTGYPQPLYCSIMNKKSPKNAKKVKIVHFVHKPYKVVNNCKILKSGGALQSAGVGGRNKRTAPPSPPEARFRGSRHIVTAGEVRTAVRMGGRGELPKLDLGRESGDEGKPPLKVCLSKLRQA